MSCTSKQPGFSAAMSTHTHVPFDVYDSLAISKWPSLVKLYEMPAAWGTVNCFMMGL